MACETLGVAVTVMDATAWATSASYEVSFGSKPLVGSSACLSVAPPERLSDRSVASVEGDAARVTVMV